LAALTRERELTTALVTGRERTDELMRALTAVETAGAHPASAGSAAVRWSPQAERKLVEALRDAPDWPSVLTEAVGVLGSEGGWDAVLAWVPDDREQLGCAARWTAPGSPDGLQTVNRHAQEKPASLLDQAMLAATPTWLADLEATGDDLLTAAAAHGMRSALLLPVRADANMVCLLELLTSAHVDPDPRLAMSLEEAALQVGRFVAQLG
jgi:hypothetical protein